MALDPAFVEKVTFGECPVNGVQSHQGGIAYGGSEQKVATERVYEVSSFHQDTDPSSGGGVFGSDFGGVPHGWRPLPAYMAGSYINMAPEQPGSFPPSCT